MMKSAGQTAAAMAQPVFSRLGAGMPFSSTVPAPPMMGAGATGDPGMELPRQAPPSPESNYDLPSPESTVSSSPSTTLLCPRRLGPPVIRRQRPTRHPVSLALPRTWLLLPAQGPRQAMARTHSPPLLISPPAPGQHPQVPRKATWRGGACRPGRPGRLEGWARGRMPRRRPTPARSTTWALPIR